jgi:Uncharacterised nucleotidyltransferase
MSSASPELGFDERRLLLACARLELDPASEATVNELLRKPIDWDALVFYARVHSIAPLVNRHLNRIDGDLVPDRARRGLLALVHRTVYQNRIFSQENTSLVSAFDAAEVPVIIPKGISVAEVIYGDLELRPLIDLLFLVEPDRFSAGFEVMLSRGYSATRVRPPHAAYEWMCPLRLFQREDASRMRVLLKAELISTPPRRHRFTTERLWPEARRAAVAGHSYLILSPIDQILYLALQADFHGHFNQAARGTVDPVELVFARWSSNRLVRFVDLHETVRHYGDELDWDGLVARARTCRIDDAAHSGLALTNDLFGPTAPPQALQALSGRAQPRLRRAVLRRVAQRLESQSPIGRVLGAGWDWLGHRRQKELFSLIGLLEVAFPGLRALRAENPSRSLPTLLGMAIWQAATTVSRSVWMFLLTAVGRHGAARFPYRTPETAEPAPELEAGATRAP